MTPRERGLAVALFQTPDRVPLEPGWGRKSTHERWRAEGMPENVNPNEHAYRLSGGTLPWPKGGEGFSIDERLRPQFEEKVIERNNDTQIVQDWKGNICEIGAEFTVDYLRNAIDFVTRRWIKCPVETRADWVEMMKRYDANDSGRYPGDAVARGQRLANREHGVTWHFSGLFWILREWLGFERLCVAFLDEPAWVQEMVDFWCEYISTLLRNGLKFMTPDCVHFSEDMAYKAHPMIGVEMSREFLLPCWRKWGEIIRGAGVPVYAMDSDGFIDDLIPLWIEAGINQCDPMEVAAGTDLPALRKRFGKSMAFFGGVDKRCIAKGGAAIENELARLRPVIQSGGYVPSCDHGVPSDIRWPDYVRYVGLLARETGWL